MAYSLKPNKWVRPIFTNSRNYCEKSIYQREEEGKKPQTVYGKEYPEWRKPWIQRDGEWSSKLSVFVEKNPSPDILNTMQQLPNLNMKKIKDWWAHVKVIQEIENQRFIAKRVAVLGSNLAALHFFTYRSAAVRLKDSIKWISGDPITLELPDRYVDGYFVEAIDCSNFHHNGIRYEGLENLLGLNFLRWLSLKNNKHVDVWCFDRIAGLCGKSLEYLDITGCQLCVGGIFALARMPKLKFLVISDPGENIEIQAALCMLEQERPNLLIKTVQAVD